jgi:hypothetical protein
MFDSMTTTCNRWIEGVSMPFMAGEAKGITAGRLIHSLARMLSWWPYPGPPFRFLAASDASSACPY